MHIQGKCRLRCEYENFLFNIFPIVKKLFMDRICAICNYQQFKQGPYWLSHTILELFTSLVYPRRGNSQHPTQQYQESKHAADHDELQEDSAASLVEAERERSVQYETVQGFIQRCQTKYKHACAMKNHNSNIWRKYKAIKMTCHSAITFTT